MLTQLHIRNFAIVDKLTIDFHNGMTAITGETGAGKSIALDALGLCLGARAESTMVRPDSERAEVTASFNVHSLPLVMQWLIEHDMLDESEREDDNCIIRRTLTAEGRSKAFINGAPVPVSLLRELGGMLVSLHGQHDHHLLMKTEYQLALLDQFANHSGLLNKVNKAFREWRALVREQRKLIEQEEAQESRRQLLQYQVNELDDFNLAADEFYELESNHKRLANASGLLEDSQFSLNCLYDGEHNNTYTLLQSVIERLNGSAELDSNLEPMVAMLNDAAVQIEEATRELRHYQDGVDLDPELLADCEKRMGIAMQLAKKHQTAPERLSELHESLKTELAELTASTERLDSMDGEIDKAKNNFATLAAELSKNREKAAAKLAEQVTNTMHKLNMPDGEFSVAIESNIEEYACSQGIDHVRFLVSANAGQPQQPINKVASGGELSRISLAIQVLTAGQDNLPTMIFDEVDVGVSGPTAATVGKLLRQLGQNNQVLCVTHLPQVAARAHQQMFVSKHTEAGKTITSMRALTDEHRIEELARLLGGDTITNHTLANARELLAG
ncbi:DNA repair protein RecN [Aliidiomarina iranensis]|uniref:DNA repair protein RecN n=1 Tax=Aliidiomarina iranensis TaxID=1434071 RepID=A0A432VWY2_9GAMM|nr:DNA repair protein RecN [Aliidiomarina iranensis]RUO21167.1 DNA repair protein RecN [Aliidiomarina iranensis]